MKLAVCLYKYFPFGGLARDFVSIMRICRDHGYQIDVFVMECQGDVPEGFNIEVIHAQGLSNHSRVANYIAQLKPKLLGQNYDLVIGFNKIPGLDIYYAADPCYLDRVKNQRDYYLAQFNPRLKFYAKCENRVFSRSSHTVSLMISDIQRDLFKKHYDTPDERLIMLPPGIDANRRRPDDWQQRRQSFRQQFAIADDELLLLMVGTGFKTKGLDRSIQALANLPRKLRTKTRLFIVGEGDITPYQKMAERLAVKDQVQFFGGRGDIPQFLLGADLLLHPARKENTGTVILEAMVAGLPVLVTAVCGYAKHVGDATSGLVITAPFNQNEFDLKLITMLDNARLKQWTDNALAYAEQEDLYSMPEKAAAIIEQMAEAKRSNENDGENHH
jgi:UDP-glucose:(heptosyl)LPS alpha-1,3-glucosyltransferase